MFFFILLMLFGSSKAYQEFGFKLKNTLIGANGTIRCLNPLDSTLLTSGSDDSYFRVWNLKENKVRDSFGKDNGGHFNQIRDLISINKDHMSTGSLDGSIKIWRVTYKETKLIKTLDSTNGGHTQGVLKLAALDNNLVSVSADKTVKIWDIQNLDQIKIKYTFDSSKDGHSGMVTSVIPIGKNRIATSSYDIKIWNLNNGTLDFTFNSTTSIFDDPVNFMVKNSEHLVATSSSTELYTPGVIKVFDLNKLELKWIFDKNNGGHEGLIFDLANLGNSGKIASVAADKIIKIWNLKLGRLEKNLIGHTDIVWISRYFGNSYLVSGAGDIEGKKSELNVWNIENGEIIYSFNQSNGGHKKRIYSFAILENGDLVSGSVDNTIKIWQVNKASQKTV